MGYFPIRYDSRVVIYDHKMFIRLATGPNTDIVGPVFHSEPLKGGYG